LRHAEAEILHEIGRKTNRAVLEALKLSRLGNRILEPAERLRRHREAIEPDDVEPHNVLRQLTVEVLAAALVKPGEHRGGAAAKHRSGAEKRCSLVLAVPVDGHSMRRVDDAIIDAVQHLERADHGTGGEQLEL
jgi:hypothetical protein